MSIACVCLWMRSRGTVTPVDGRGRWEALFADLEAEYDAAGSDEHDAEVRDRVRIEHARLTLADRLRAHVGATITVTTNGAGVIRGTLTDAEPGWLVLGDTLVPASAIREVGGLGPRASEPKPAPKRPLPLGYALRALADSGDPVACTFTDGRTVRATIERVGADHVDIGGVAVPFRRIAAIRPAD